MAAIPSCLRCGPVPWGPTSSGNLHLRGAPTGAPKGPQQAELVSFMWDQRWCLSSPHKVLGGQRGLPGVSEVWGARPASPAAPVGAGPWPQGSGQCQLPLGIYIRLLVPVGNTLDGRRRPWHLGCDSDLPAS